MPTDITKFTLNENVLQILSDFKKEKYKNKIYSDVIDNNGNQYVDLVLEGGGVLGMALIGYIYILEELNIRFLGLGGTSAGSIVTLLMACDKVENKKSEWIIEELCKIDFREFLDFHNGDDDADKLISLIQNDSGGFKKYFNLFSLLNNFRDAKKNYGLVKGDKFSKWLKSVIGKKRDNEMNGIKTLKDLKEIRSIVPEGFKKREGTFDADKFKFDEKCSRVAIIAADITTETKVEFPRMAELYWKKPDEINPVDFVRASMSIPFLFNPFEISGIVHDKSLWEKWEKEINFKGHIPEKVKFIDGGIISNFPINIFHRANSLPTRPTFGVKLGDDRGEINNIDSIYSLLIATFSTARHSLDNEYIDNNKDYEKLVTFINTKRFNWLNFNMTDEQKINLFVEGAQSACEFLKDFDWDEYKKIRESLLKNNGSDNQSLVQPAKPAST
ncbi:MAG: patatin-like phospholipase family protein [bacterium]